MSQNKVPKSENILTASCENKRAIFSVPKSKLEILEFLHKYAKLCSLCTQICIETGLVSSNRASLPLPMWSSGDSRPSVPWSPEERRREMTNLIANQKGAASKFYNYPPDDVHEHDVDVTRWASRGVAEAVPRDSCTPRAMPPRACCVLGLCLYRGSAS